MLRLTYEIRVSWSDVKVTVKVFDGSIMFSLKNTVRNKLLK